MNRFFLPVLCGVLSAASAVADPVFVGKFQAKVVPEQVVPLVLGDHGTLTGLVDASQPVKAGTVVGVLNKERTEQEREDMEFDLERERLNTRDEIRKLTVQREKVAFYLNLSEEERKYATDLKSDERSMTEETLRDLDERISMLKRQSETMERRKRTEFDRNHEKLTAKMPFDGRLQYSFSVPDDITKPMEYNPSVAQGFATACDDSSLYICLNISNSELTQLPAENFTVHLTLPRNKTLVASFDHSKVERGGNSDMLVYYFRVKDEDHDTAYKMLGSMAQAQLLYEPGENTTRIRKSVLAARPEAAQCENWEQLVRLVYPEAEIILIADRDIVLQQQKP